MQKVLVHVAMVLLGVTLAVSFYEGRRLVKNTAKAFSAAATLSTTGGRHAAREGLAGVGEDHEEEDVDVSSLGAAPARPAAERTMRIDPQQVASTRLRARQHLLEPGAEPSEPRGKRGKGGRRGGRAERLRAGVELPERALGPLQRVEEGPLALPAEEEEFLEDTALP